MLALDSAIVNSSTGAFSGRSPRPGWSGGITVVTAQKAAYVTATPSAPPRPARAFGEQLAHEARAARAERRAHRDLAVAGGGAGEQQIRHVDAGDQQQQADRAEQARRPDRRSQLANVSPNDTNATRNDVPTRSGARAEIVTIGRNDASAAAGAPGPSGP